MNSLQTNDDLAQALIKAETEEELQKVTALFNLDLKKKAIIRASKLSELQDSITSEMSNRVDTRSAEFSNKDLLDYMKVIQDIISKSDMTPEMPSTLLLMQENHIHADENTSPMLSKESKDKIRMALEELLSQKEVAQDVEEEL